LKFNKQDYSIAVLLFYNFEEFVVVTGHFMQLIDMASLLETCMLLLLYVTGSPYLAHIA